MNIKSITSFIALTVLATTMSTQAHDIKEHMKDGEQPKCAAMKGMDHSKMDMNDPVMQAMMKQCMNQMHNDNKQAADSDKEHSKPEGSADAASAEHQH